MKTIPHMQKIGAVRTVMVMDAAAVALTAAVKSDIVDLSQFSDFSICYQAISPGGVPDVTITIEQGIGEDLTGFATPVSMAAVHSNLTAETKQIKAISPVSARYLRFVVTGEIANPADTVFSLWISARET